MASKRPPLKYRKFRKIMESFGLREVKKQGKGCEFKSETQRHGSSVRSFRTSRGVR